MTYRPDIDGLRALAVVPVVVFHAFPTILPGGFAGVDVFFVISGFLISGIIVQDLQNAEFSFLNFYRRRVIRIFPALILIMAAACLFGWYGLLADEYMQLGDQVAGGAAFVANVVFWNSAGYFDNAADTKPLLHLWSLGIEEQFYIIWPLMLWLCTRFRLDLLVVVVSLAALSFATSLHLTDHDPLAAFYSPWSRAWELAIGCVIALLAKAPVAENKLSHADSPVLDGAMTVQNAIGRLWTPAVTSPARDVMAAGGVAMVVAAFLSLDRGDAFPGVGALMPVMGTAMVLAAGPDAWFNRVILNARPLVWVGLISYPLYLWHWPLLSMLRITESTTPDPALRGLCVALSLLLAWMTFRLVEQPIRQSGRRRTWSTALLGAMGIVGIAGYAISEYQGFIERPSIVQFENNRNELIRTPIEDDRCLEYQGEQREKLSYCRFFDSPGERTVAVIGDSHAHVAFPGIARLLAERRFDTVLLANSSCPPLKGMTTGTTDEEHRLCEERTNSLLNTLAEKSDIVQVIFFSRGAVYLDGWEPMDPEKDLMAGQTITAERFRQGLQNSIDWITAAGKTVVFVAENPELNKPAESCVGRPFRLMPMKCGASRQEVIERQHDYLAMLDQLDNATVVRTIDAFCPDDECMVFFNGELLYADDDHLSVAGSRFLAERVLRDALP